MNKVYILIAGSYDLHGTGTKTVCALNDVWEANTGIVSSLIQGGSMRVATGQEITTAMANGTAH